MTTTPVCPFTDKTGADIAEVMYPASLLSNDILSPDWMAKPERESKAF